MIKRGYKDAMRGVDSQHISRLIDAYVHSERDREIIRLSLIHGVSYSRIADRLEDWVSPRTVQAVMNRWMPILLDKLKR